VIYFIQGARGGPIKIGSAGNPWQRAAALQTGNPNKLSVIAVIPGGRAEEAALHSKFASLREHGEWFSPSSDLVSFIDGVKAAQREAPPQPTDEDEDTLLGLSREQVEAIVESVRGIETCRRAVNIIESYDGRASLPPDVLQDATSIALRLESIEDAIEFHKTRGIGLDGLLAGASFFDGHGGYGRRQLIVNLKDMIARQTDVSDLDDDPVNSGIVLN